MARIQLRLYLSPGQAEIFIKVKDKQGEFQRMTAIVDTGAETSTLPARLMNSLDYEVTSRGIIMVDQAGIAKQTFQATEAMVTMILEDISGNVSNELQVLVWFVDSEIALLGFDGILDRAILHINMRDEHSGCIEI